MGVTVKKCMQAWTNSLRQMNAKADIVFLGDSLTYYGDFTSVFPDKVVCNLGLRGDTIQGMIDRMEQVQILEPKHVFLMAGINDVMVCNECEFDNRYENLIKSLTEKVDNIKLIVQSILPVNDKNFSIFCNNESINRCNKMIFQIAVRYGLKYIDLYALYVKNGMLPKEDTIDGIHLHKHAYTIWNKELQQEIIG